MAQVALDSLVFPADAAVVELPQLQLSAVHLLLRCLRAWVVFLAVVVPQHVDADLREMLRNFDETKLFDVVPIQVSQQHCSS